MNIELLFLLVVIFLGLFTLGFSRTFIIRSVTITVGGIVAYSLFGGGVVALLLFTFSIAAAVFYSSNPEKAWGWLGKLAIKFEEDEE